jgi:hypothetical protein
LARLELPAQLIPAKSAQELLSSAFVSLLIEPFAAMVAELRTALNSYKAEQAKAIGPNAAGTSTQDLPLQLSPEQISALEERIGEMVTAINGLDPIQIATEHGISCATQSSNKRSGSEVYTAGRQSSEPKAEAKPPTSVRTVSPEPQQQPSGQLHEHSSGTASP